MHALRSEAHDPATDGELAAGERQGHRGLGREHVPDGTPVPDGKQPGDQGGLDSLERELDLDYSGGYPDRRGLPLRSYVEQRTQEGVPVGVLARPHRDPLTDKNWRIYAAKNYDNTQCIGDEEFEQDLKRLKYIKKALTRYETTGELGERLILNHLIVLCNVFGPSAVVRLIYLRMNDQLSMVKPFLVMLRVLPPIVHAVAGKDWYTDEVLMDQRVVDALRKI